MTKPVIHPIKAAEQKTTPCGEARERALSSLLVSRRESLAAVVGGLGTLVLAACGSSSHADPSDESGGATGEASADGGAKTARDAGSSSGTQSGSGADAAVKPSGNGSTLDGGADTNANSASSTADATSPSSAAGGDAGQHATSSAGDSGSGAPQVCMLMPEQEEGPFFVAMAVVRKNIVDGKAGLPFTLRITLVDPKQSCAPIQNAAIDVWTCDALGVYSKATDGMFLRGVQLTDANGTLEFETIFPGWYPARSNHIHVKVHIGGQVAGMNYTGGHVSHTGNLFIPEDLCVAVSKQAPYTANTVTRKTLSQDMVFNSQNGAKAMLTVTLVDPAKPELGYVGSIVLGADPTATPGLIGVHS